jgi:organic hydroperoxide reductase OsmC/OhrA
VKIAEAVVMSNERDYHITLRSVQGYEFVAEFDDAEDLPPLVFDEPPPLGESCGPNAAAVLGAAVGNCLAASLAFCLRKSRLEIERLTAHVVTHVIRNEQGRFRVGGIDVELTPTLTADDSARFARCEALFEDFCVVTESVRRGIPVNVTFTQPKVVELQWRP